MFPAFGFGAQVPPDYKVIECSVYIVYQHALCQADASGNLNALGFRWLNHTSLPHFFPQSII